MLVLLRLSARNPQSQRNRLLLSHHQQPAKWRSVPKIPSKGKDTTFQRGRKKRKKFQRRVMTRRLMEDLKRLTNNRTALENRPPRAPRGRRSSRARPLTAKGMHHNSFTRQWLRRTDLARHGRDMYTTFPRTRPRSNATRAQYSSVMCQWKLQKARYVRVPFLPCLVTVSPIVSLP